MGTSGLSASWAHQTHQRKPPAGAEHISKGTSDLRFERCGAFFTSLSERLDALQGEVQPKWLTLEWVTTAVDFMRSTFAGMISLMDQEDVCKAADDQRPWIEEYMVESMKLLDVCNVLKPALSRFEHFVMCVQLVVKAMQRCVGGSKRCASDIALVAALQSCESVLGNQLVHMGCSSSQAASSQPDLRVLRLTPKSSNHGPHRYASIAIGEIFSSADGISPSMPYLGPPKLHRSVEASRSSVELTLVLRATRETTDFVASILIWALKRDPTSSHPAPISWQRKGEGIRGVDNRWSLSFRRLQEGLWKALSEVYCNGPSVSRQFAFEELKLVADVKVEIEELAAREKLGEEPSVQLLKNLGQQLVQLLDIIQIRLDKVSSQVDQLFGELVQARKKLLDAAQRPGKILRAHSF